MEITSLALTGVLALMPITILCLLAFWKEVHLLFMLASVTALMTGLYMPDILSGESETTGLGIAAGLSFIMLALVLTAFAYKMMFWREV